MMKQEINGSVSGKKEFFAGPGLEARICQDRRQTADRRQMPRFTEDRRNRNRREAR